MMVVWTHYATIYERIGERDANGKLNPEVNLPECGP